MTISRTRMRWASAMAAVLAASALTMVPAHATDPDPATRTCSTVTKGQIPRTHKRNDLSLPALNLFSSGGLPTA